MLEKFYALPRWLRDIIPLIFWMALIFGLSSRSTLIDFGDGSVTDRLFYKTSHITAYAIMAWLWWRALAPQRQTSWPVLFTALILTILYAISDEFHQSFVPGRNAKLYDILFDTSGALAMILLIRYSQRLRYKLPVIYTLMSL